MGGGAGPAGQVLAGPLFCLINYRVSNRKGRSIPNEFVLVVSSRPTLGKIETTPHIGYARGKVRETAILNHKPKYKKWLRDQNYVHRGRRTSCQATSRGYFESLTTDVVWRTPQTTSTVVYLSASAPAPMRAWCWSRSFFLYLHI